VDFIFMLTRDDQTIEDCLETFTAIETLGLSHVGFKDMGVPPDTLRELHQRIRATGATTYLEVVSTDQEACRASARTARELGVDRLMGGTEVEDMLGELAGTAIEYLPFPGLPVGHPTLLGGSPALVERQCRDFAGQGCAGVDLLAYRATEADPIDLVRAARRGTAGYLVVAGSVDSAERIDDLRRAGADAFTIGSAVLTGAFSPRKGLITSQLRDVLGACA
jgi:glycerate-2-kinase